MIVIELMQGYYRNLTGQPRDAMLVQFAADDADFVARNPQCAPYHRPSWREIEVGDNETARWGHEWYILDEAGLLKMHSAQYDSSG